MSVSESELRHLPELPPRVDYGIGAIGAGFIMRDVQIPSYRKAGMNVVAIASRTRESAQKAAEQNGVATVYDTWQELLDDERVEIVDIAFPPDRQLEIVREVVKHGDHVKGVLAQKPLAVNLPEAAEIVKLCSDAGIVLAVNQNMRYDQSIRSLKTLLDRGALGTPVVAQITMHARPHWAEFVRGYGRIALLNMSIHHLDAFRYLFGDPERIMVSVRSDPSWDFPHEDGLGCYVLEYADGLRAIGIDNCFTWVDQGIEWRVEGTGGVAKGTIGWPDYPAGSPSTIDWTTRADEGEWHRPRWREQWFPDAFAGTMGQLMRAIQEGSEPEISGHDNLRTMALVEAAYRSVDEGRSITVREMEYLAVGP